MDAPIWNPIYPHGTFAGTLEIRPDLTRLANGPVLYSVCIEGHEYLVKEIPFNDDKDKFDATVVMKVDKLRALDHENTTKYFGLVIRQQEGNRNWINYRISSRYYSGGNLKQWVQQAAKARPLIKQCLPHATIRQFLRDLLTGLDCIHSNFDIIHCDIKPQNLVLRHTGYQRLVIVDFEGAIFQEESQDRLENVDFTALYAAPEVSLRCAELAVGLEHPAKISHKSDIWSVGCVALQMYTGYSPVIQQWEKSPESMADDWDGSYRKICYTEPEAIMFQLMFQQARPLVSSNMDPLLKDFVKLCLQFNMDSRRTAAELLRDLNGYLYLSN
ncbi:uncharacterized protein LOC129602477 [Paramacrobiotus metropolitanus]|uniref:uncharacterized protein LOC129602477 n=1 Tax=Paramacrobiotus metropolitanus TaxID=2943436 RepID=UPI0024462844|nr:uncharacterized protein LOC129602477 [Paramacrobiotus metropolitanus]